MADSSSPPCDTSVPDTPWLEPGSSSWGVLLESYRTYLLQIAQAELDRELQIKVSPSDLVQETFLAAQRSVREFRGRSPEHLLEWLRKILTHKLLDAQRRFYRTQRRELKREIRWQDAESRARLAYERPLKTNTPSRQMAAAEEIDRISVALSSLPPRYQQVIRWRNWELLSFEEIGRRMNRTAGAVRALWLRALQHLAKALERQDG